MTDVARDPVWSDALAAVRQAVGARTTGVGRLCGIRWTCSHCGREHAVKAEAIGFGADAAQTAARFVRDRGAGRVLLVTDETVHGLHGVAVEESLRNAGIAQATMILPAEVKPMGEAAQEVADRVASADNMLVSLSSGAVNDLTKAAAFSRDKPYISLATAPSMNGYLSSITALEVEGVKRTLAARPPVAVFADPAWLATAPSRLCAAGFADWMSKPVANTDWYIASALTDGDYCPVPYQLLEATEAVVLAIAEDLTAGDVAARMSLLEGLLYSGTAMMLAGNSSPASGGEHLISHYLDMFGDQLGFKCVLHGEQVAIGVLVSSAIYEMLTTMPIPAVATPVPFDQLWQGRAAWYGGTADAVHTEFAAKYGDEQAVAARRQRLREQWDGLREQWQRFVWPVARVRSTLREAGAVHRAAQIDLPRDVLRECILYGREIRGRYTVLDLAYDCGLLPDAADDIIDRSGVCAADAP